MNPFGLFQGFGQMSRSDFKAPPWAPQPPASRPARGNGNVDPYGVRPARRVASLPADYAYQERLMSTRAGGQGLQGSPAVRGQTVRPVPVAPVYDRPARIGAGDSNQDYRVPAGQAPMPVAAQRPPAGSTASRANAVMTPLGASRNEALVQAAGNAGMRLADPASFKMFAGNGVLPATSADASRRMLSEFGSGRASLLEAAGRAAPGAGNAGMQLAAPAAYETLAGNRVLPATSEGMSRQMLSEFGSGRPPLTGASREIGSAVLSAETLAAAAGAYSPEATGGDRFSGLRPDLAAWARSNQGAARGADGMNIVDRFMAKQGAAPLAAPVDFPQAMAVDPAHSYTSPGVLATAGANIGRSAEAQALDSNAFGRPMAASAATAFNPETDLVDQVQLMREMYRNNSRPNPGAVNLPFRN